MTKAAESIEITLPDEVPPGWRRTTLGEIGEYINGRGFKKSEWAEQGLPIIRIQNLTGTGKEQNYYDGEIDERNVVNPGDLLISWAATLGAYLWAGPRAALNQHIFKVRSFVDKKFHYYLMQHILGDLYRQTHGSGMVHITKSKFDSMPIVVPETEYQQKRIVAEIEKQFSRLDEAVANLKRVKANLKRYKAAVLKAAVEGRLVETEAEVARREGRSYETGAQLLQRILETRRSKWQGKGQYKGPTAPDTTGLPELPEGWVWASVDQLAAPVLNSITDGPFGSNLKTEHYQESGPRVIRLQNIKDGEFADEYAHISPTHFERLRKHEIQAGDLVIATLGDNPPRACIIPAFVGAAIVKADCIRFKPHSALTVAYLNAALNCQPTRKRVKNVLHGIGRPRLSLGEIRAIALPIPPETEQYRIVAEVDHRQSLLREIEAQVDTNFKRAERLRQSILGKAYAG